MKIYKLKNAIITITGGEKTHANKVKKDLLEQIRLTREKANAPGLEIKQRRLAGSDITYYRKQYKSTWGETNISVKLTEPKYLGYQFAFEEEFREEESLHVVLKRSKSMAIRQFRTGYKTQAHTTAYLHDTKVKFFGKFKKGMIFAEPGQVLKIYIKKNLKELYAIKKPVSADKHVGVELEFCAPISEDLLALKLFNAGIHKYAQLKKDGSLRPFPGETAFELAVLLKQSDYKKDLKKITDLLASVGAKAEERRCGLHVHLDMRHRNKTIAYSNLVDCQNMLLALVHPERRDGEFCETVYSRKFPTKFTENKRTMRYKTINASAYYMHKTLEVRMHEGSVDYDQISNWISLLTRIVDFKKPIKKSIKSLTNLKKKFKLSKRVYDYSVDRYCYFQVNNETTRPQALDAMREHAAQIPLAIFDENTIFGNTTATATLRTGTTR